MNVLLSPYLQTLPIPSTESENMVGQKYDYFSDVYLAQTEDSVLPIEVKAEEDVKSKSLRQFITIDHAEKHLKGIRLSMKPYIDQGWMENIPLYAAGFLLKPYHTL